MFGRLASACILAFALALAAPAVRAQTVSVGVVATLSGPAASLGQQLRDGFALGVESLGGKLGGMPTTVTVIDDELKPDVAVTKIRGLLDGDKASFVVGPIFSNVLSAIIKPVTDANVFLLSPNAGPSTYAGRACNPNLFVTSYQNDQIHAVLGQYAQESGYKRVFLLAPNYQAGRDAVAGFKSKFKGEIVEEAYVPLNQLDFQSELAKIAAAKPDAIFTFMPGGLGIALVKQYRQAGLANIPFLSSFTVDESVLPAEQDAALGFYSGTNWAPDLDVPANKVFVAAFEKKFGYVPATYAAQAFDTALLIDSAIKSAGGITDHAKLRAALERADFASVRGPFRFSPNHYPVQDFYLAQVAKRADGKYETQIRKKVFANDVDIYAAQCKMP
jgi:branched-chain amino acid transport system substrate-binding protein